MAEDIARWLEGVGLQQYAKAFIENDVDLEILPELTEDDLRDLGLSLGHRRRLLKAIAKLTATEGAVVVETPQAERRQLTVLFCDLVGSTALTAKLDPDDMRDVLRDYQVACAKVIDRYEGFVAKFMGDGVYAYFGYPVAHEDDVVRAINAGLGIIEEVAALERNLAVRIGVATGNVAVGDLIGQGASEEVNVVGEAPNLAARLQEIAKPNTLVIGEATHALISGHFDMADLGRRSLKGFSDPVHAWTVLRVRPTESRFEATRGAHLTTFVGRDEELEILLRRWQRAKSGDGQVALISGEPGIGKSRLIHALRARMHAEPSYVRVLQCSAYHMNSAMFPFLEQAALAIGLKPDDTNEDQLDKLETWIDAAGQDPKTMAPIFGPLLKIDTSARYPLANFPPQKQKEMLLDTFAKRFEGLSRQRPFLMVIEDAHWIDPTSLELLNMLINQVSECAALIVISFRPEFEAPWIGQSYASLISLNRLNRMDCESMVGDICGDSDLEDELVNDIADRTDGVPLFVEELTKAVLEASEEGEATREFSVPASLQDSLAARLDRLGPAKEIAQIGAVIGRAFDYDLVLSISTLDDQALKQRLDILVNAGLVIEQGLAPNTTYTFKHALVQDTAYNSLLRGPRESIHASVAEALKTRFSEKIEQQPELLAHHYTQAKITHEAIPYWLRAGERAVALSAHLEAIEHLNSGLGLIRDLPEDQTRTRHELALLSAMGPPLIATRGYGASEVKDAYMRARELWQDVGSTTQLCPILYGLWAYHSTRAEHQIAKTLCKDLMDAAETTRDRSSLLDAHVACSITSLLTGQFDRARQHADRGLSLFDPERHRFHALQNPGIVCRIAGASAAWFLGYPNQAFTLFHETLGLARELSHPFSLAVTLTWFTMLLQYNREAAEAQTLAEEAMALSEELGFPTWLSAAGMVKGWALAEQGLQEKGKKQFHESMALAEAIETRLWQPYGLYLAVEAGEKAELLDRALTLAKTTGEQYWEAELHRQKGMMLLDGPNEDPAAAEACFKEAIEVSRRQRAKSLELRAATCLSRLWHSQGKTAEARDLLAPLYGWFTEELDTADLGDAKALLTELS